ncbi:hypothetical protein Q669_29640 [Labrenzia sp. C1B10]|nr:hypothetical protein Q669_29640 [Labrenzia sp. C1B10]ERS05800.1 hypothetical protein Q675_29205 [Labrenzia sp. C1B70]
MPIRGKAYILMFAVLAALIGPAGKPAEADSRCVLYVETFDGESFIAGDGDTCADAMHGARFPENWRLIEFRETEGTQDNVKRI